jgi:hypothetical protein
VSLRSRWQAFRNAMRASSLMGRAFRLRDRGELEDALSTCQEAIRIVRPVGDTVPSAGASGTMLIGALTLFEIARRLGRPEIAREPLETALALLEPLFRTGRPSVELIRTQRQVRAHLEELRSAG